MHDAVVLFARPVRRSTLVLCARSFLNRRLFPAAAERKKPSWLDCVLLRNENQRGLRVRIGEVITILDLKVKRITARNGGCRS
ncbi:MAG: hypothetical protein C4519_17360 [Desulfobacteraceae bacterium]|nr:MAG: hypothetical protein C4519_17360 [Desulfobacteraceae bacterium]